MAKIKTRARAVDMLGRQQIAGTQNAINELFKNSYDAYAKQARIDFFEEDGSLVIRDDGVGMTREDFEDKWLVLGTDSKTGDNGQRQYRPADMEARPVTGEKGIGRLAIALLGSQVLVLTRANRNDGLHDQVISLVHWGLFEMPGLNLDEIEIPVKTIPGGSIATAAHVESLKASLLKCVERLSAQHTELDFSIIRRGMERFTPDPEDLDGFFAARDGNEMSLRDSGTGTHFIIAPVNQILSIELELEERNEDAGFSKQLLGFSDTVFGNHTGHAIATSFRRWQPGALAGHELLDPPTFFTKEQLEHGSDHLLKGNVDAFGQFSGSLRVYQQQYDNVVVPWSEAHGIPTECGPFSVIFGYLMGRESESLVVGEEYTDLNFKLDRIGGVYVYRDGIRVLPYGDFSVDWLEVEKRRNKGAGYYFFSFRRMFGAVLLTRKDNEALQEKAGREGFQQNKAYRQVREIMINLLVQLAAEFFRDGNEKGDLFESTQAEMRRRSEALARQQKRSTEKRKVFAKKIETFLTDVKAGIPEASLQSLRELTRAKMEAAAQISDRDKAAAALIRAEREAVSGLTELRERFTCARPSGVALTKELTRELDGYRFERARLDSKLFAPFEGEIVSRLAEVARHARLYIDQRKRLEGGLKALAEERHRHLEAVVTQTRESASDTRKTVFDITQKAMLALDLTAKQIEADLYSTDFSALSEDRIEELRKRWEGQLSDIETRHREALMAARDMLSALAENLRASDGEEPAQAMEALEQRMLSLEEEADENFEMVQLGLAVAIINHEFAAAIRNVRRSVQELGQISKRSDALRPLYQTIRSNFEHLDGHLKLFTPLQRRLYRTAQTISGQSIQNYVTDLFGGRLERHHVSPEPTKEFLKATVECYPSTLYPAVINLVDNAIFWLTQVKGERKIRFDVSGEDLIIANTGPSIESRDQMRIFERGFSRKPSGRGLGLFISARALLAENMHLRIETPPPGFNVAFHISAPTLKLHS